MSSELPAGCPLCGRRIVPGKAVCACGAVLHYERGEAPPSENVTRKFDVGVLAPWVPVAGFLLLIFWILPARSTPYAGMSLFKVAAVTVILSSLLSLLDADRIRKQDWPLAHSAFSGLTPLSWFAALLAVWPVTFPAFMHTHYFHARHQRMLLGWATSGLFVVTLLITWIVVARSPAWPTAPASALRSRAPTVRAAGQSGEAANSAPESAPAPSMSPVPAVPMPAAVPPATPAPDQLPSPSPRGSQKSDGRPSFGISIPGRKENG